MALYQIEVELDQFTDEDIKDEYESRGLNGSDTSWDETTMLTKIWIADREGRKDEAYTLMREYVLEKLNKVV